MTSPGLSLRPNTLQRKRRVPRKGIRAVGEHTGHPGTLTRPGALGRCPPQSRPPPLSPRIPPVNWGLVLGAVAAGLCALSGVGGTSLLGPLVGLPPWGHQQPAPPLAALHAGLPGAGARSGLWARSHVLIRQTGICPSHTRRAQLPGQCPSPQTAPPLSPGSRASRRVPFPSRLSRTEALATLSPVRQWPTLTAPGPARNQPSRFPGSVRGQCGRWEDCPAH